MIFSSAEITSINALKKQSFSAAGKKWGRDLTYFAKWQQKECGKSLVAAVHLTRFRKR